LDDPLESCERAIAIDHKNIQAMLVCASVLREHDRNARAVACLDGAIAFDPSRADARIASCLCELPIVYSDAEEIEQSRKAYTRKLRALYQDYERGFLKGDLVQATAAVQPFYLAYQAQSDRDLQRLYGSMLSGMMARQFEPVSLPAPPAPGKPVRVGIVSS